MRIRRWGRLTFQRRRSLLFYAFTSPFIIGFVLFFLGPFIQAIIFSVHKLAIVSGGYELLYVGAGNYRYAFTIDAEYTRTLVETALRTLSEVPLVLGFSFFAATVLNQRFRGRMVARAIFFLPVIMGAGIIRQMEQMDYMYSLMQSGLEDTPSILSSTTLARLLVQMKLPTGLIQYVLNGVGHIPEIIRSSGIQILVFLAGLQSVPPPLYEAAIVEGGTRWENFWMITLPILSPLILTNIVYTVIDSFMSGSNELVTLVQRAAFSGAGYGVSTAMGVTYFGVVSAILVILIAVASRFVFYQE